MNRVFRSFSLLLLCLCGAVNAGNVDTAVVKFTRASLSNDIISLQFLPGAEGRIVSLKFGDVEMFSPYRAEQLAGNPLFAPVSANSRGYSERFWKRALSSAPLPVNCYKLHGRRAADVEMRFFGNTTLHVHRRMELHPSGAVLELVSAVSSTENADSAAYSSTVFPDFRAEIFFPAKIGNDEVTANASAEDSTRRYVPARPFAWCCYRGIIMAIVADDADFLMSWRARDSGLRKERTMEIIGKTHPLPHTWRNRFIFFQRLKSLRGICGVRGFDIQPGKNGKAVLLIEAAAPVEAARAVLDGITIHLPAQKFGEVKVVELPALPAKRFPELKLLP